jgi:hypothetical protein
MINEVKEIMKTINEIILQIDVLYKLLDKASNEDILPIDDCICLQKGKYEVFRMMQKIEAMRD